MSEVLAFDWWGTTIVGVLDTARSGREQSLTETTAALLGYLIGAAWIARWSMAWPRVGRRHWPALAAVLRYADIS